MKKIILASAVAAFMLPGAAFAQATMSTDSTTTASTTTDLTGNYTIVNNLAALNPTNSKTDPMQVQSTIDANPGLADALAKNGIKTADIGSIQIKPNGQVEVYGKGS